MIRATDYREKDKIINVFTPRGIVPFVVKGVRTPGAKLKNLSSIMVCADFNYQCGRSGNILSGGEIIESFYPCWVDAKKYASVMICLETIEKFFTREEDTHDEFICFIKTMAEIAYGDEPIKRVLYFCLKCAERIGCDYSYFEENDPSAYHVMSSVYNEVETDSFNEKELFSALKSFFLFCKNEFGFSVHSVREAEKLFFAL